MTRRSAIRTVIVAALISAVALWFVTKEHETDVYLAALEPFPQLAPVLSSRPSTCSGTIHYPDLSEDLLVRGFLRVSPGLSEDLVRRFLRANGPGSTPISLRSLRWNYATVDPKKVRQLIAAGFSVRFPIPNGPAVVYLSRVGYNTHHTEALFCLEGDGGALLYLRKVDGMWRVVNVYDAWVR